MIANARRSASSASIAALSSWARGSSGPIRPCSSRSRSSAARQRASRSVARASSRRRCPGGASEAALQARQGVVVLSLNDLDHRPQLKLAFAQARLAL